MKHITEPLMTVSKQLRITEQNYTVYVQAAPSYFDYVISGAEYPDDFISGIDTTEEGI
ncbi:MAG: hypothetical protein R2741_09570 [Methanolobus sp.]